MSRLCVVAWVLLAACGGPRVLSEYGSITDVRRNDDGSARFRYAPHDGVDIATQYTGDPVIASFGGFVYSVRRTPAAGYEVVLIHSRGFFTGYSHLMRVDVEKGDYVDRGDPLGRIGMFREEGGLEHVHWRLWRRSPMVGTRTRDPLSMTVGCFDTKATYPQDRVALTYPVGC